MVDPNTRQGKRTPVTLKIKFKSETLEQFIERYAVDVSQGGIFIRTKEPLAVGTQMKFEFQLRDASPLIAGEGTVVWTRENDPSRPAIAPGMGVRFDRLAEGSQAVLERILAEKAKQAPQRPNNETTKPPLFTDTPTRVAPAPVQEALLGQESSAQGKPRRRPDSHNEHTPLPKPMPFHSDADEFPDEAFEEATKVRALDELIAQTAEGSSNGLPAMPGAGARADATVPDPRAITRAETHERESAPGLPSPPEPATRGQGRLLDTSPSPRNEPAGGAAPSLPEAMARTRLGVEPAPANVGRARVSTPPANVAIKDAPTQPTGMRAVAAEPTAPARMPASGNSNNAAIVIISLLVVAAAGAAVWFFVLRPQEEEKTAPKPGSGAVITGSGSAGSAGSGSGVAMTGSGSNVEAPGSGATPGSNANVPKADLVDTVIASAIPNATVEIEGSDQTGAAPFTAKLEKDKPYKAKVRAPGFAALELDVKGGEKPAPAKLVAKPRVITVTSDPPGAAILVDDKATGHSTPFDVELTPAQGAKKSVRVGLRKGGYKYVEKAVDLTKLTEDDARMVGKLDEKLSVQVVVRPNPNPNPGAGAGSNKGSAAAAGVDAGTGPVTSPGGSGAEPGSSGSGGSGGSGASAGSGAGSSAPAPGKGSSEPEPDFNKQP